ncbi:cytochrome c556 [Angulomicrobium tetraedrale]|uniref:Cytochrome c556 n=1 Tax=Ancylobacter tetraedralis TaxID=217068 RepID=A0A839ZDG1_9HYPH|nr:cytochrome c [Ancylobacter tetraedralis]MBB3772833.1 cytochrome c556 [Ancylobacter tetraedralis]
MRLRLAVFAAFASALAATAVMAQSDVIAQREALMKEFGRATRPVGGMLRGGTPFDLAAVQSALDVYARNAKALVPLFPEGSGGGETEALPSIWQKKAEFDGLFDKFAADATAARAAITDEASFKAIFPGVIRTCGTCHDSFRKKS